jgi:hypothetical protein
MESKKINQLATEMAPAASDLTIIGDPITGVSKKITLLQLSTTIGAGADLQGVTDNGATTTNPIAIGGLTITGLATGVLKSNSGVIASVPFGAANGVATLGGDGKVPSNQLPSYVDDVVEVANFAALPVTGETGKLYVTLDNNKVYRWTGSTYVEIAANNAVWGAITGTLSNQTDLQSALNARIPYTGATSAIDLNAKSVVNISNLGINTTSVPTILFRAVGDNNSNSRIAVRGYSSNANSSSMRVTKFRGTVGAPQAPQSGDSLGKFELAGYGTTSSEGYPQASFEGLATESWGATARGSKVVVKVTPNTTITQAIALTINQDKSAVFENSITGTSIIKSGGTSSQFLKADGSVDSTTYQSAITLTTTGTSGAATLVGSTLNIPNYGSALSSYVTLGTTQTITGSKFFDGEVVFNNGVFHNSTTFNYGNNVFYHSATLGFVSGATTIVGVANGVKFGLPSTASTQFTFNNTVGLVYTFPSTSGTIALTSDLSGYIQGSGTTNYVPKFTASGTIGNSLIYDNGTNVGIGTSTPISLLSISKSLSADTTYLTLDNKTNTKYNWGINWAVNDSSTIPVAAIRAIYPADNDVSLGFYTYNGTGNVSERMRITSGGKLLVRTTTSTAGAGGDRIIEADGNMFSKGTDAGYFWQDRSNSANFYGWYTTSNTIYLFNGSANAASISPSTGVYTSLSDVNKKKDFEESAIGLDAILGLKPTLYRMKTDETEGNKELGFIAQEVKDFIPQAYVESGDFIGLNFNPIVAALVKAIQEQTQIIKDLESRIVSLESK